MGVLKQATHSFIKVYNFVQREFAYLSQVDLSDKYIPYFQGNDNFPTELSELVRGSPTATSCLSTLTDFYTGEGFNKGSNLENLVLNKNGLTLFQFHNIMAGSLAHDWGMASLIKYNRLGQITEVTDLQFSNCRLGVPDSNGIISKIKYNPYFGTELYRSADTVEYDVFNPGAATMQAANDKKWKGQIFWFGIRSKHHPFYPVPDYYSARSWMNVEKNSGIYFDENLENGFLTPTILKLFGDPNEPSGLKDENDNDIPKGKAFDMEMSKNFKGAKRVGHIMAFWGNNENEWPKTEAFPTNSNADMHRMTDDHATKKITIATKVVGILANIQDGVSLGGDGNTIRAAVKLMQQRSKRPQEILIGYYTEILKNLVNPVTTPLKIVPYNPFPELESIDPSVWAEMTPEERRKWINDHTEIELSPSTTSAQQSQPALPAQNKIVNLHFDSYPKAAKENVKRALDWQTKMDLKCLPKSGMELSTMITDGRPLGPKEIRRLSNFLSKNVTSKDKPYDQSCEAVKFDAWGGVDMMTWANERIKELKGITD
jgi:hypothetical protein